MRRLRCQLAGRGRGWLLAPLRPTSHNYAQGQQPNCILSPLNTQRLGFKPTNMGDTITTEVPPPEKSPEEPSEEETDEEPPFPLTPMDKWILAQTDEEFARHDWQSLRDIIGS